MQLTCCMPVKCKNTLIIDGACLLTFTDKGRQCQHQENYCPLPVLSFVKGLFFSDLEHKIKKSWCKFLSKTCIWNKSSLLFVYIIKSYIHIEMYHTVECNGFVCNLSLLIFGVFLCVESMCVYIYIYICYAVWNSKQIYLWKKC